MTTRNGQTLDSRRPEGGTVHLVYPHGSRIEAPDSIGRNLGERLQARYRVVYHDWTDRGVIQPGSGDVLLGHPHPSPSTIFRKSSLLDGWRRIIMISPYNENPGQVAFLDSFIRRCDLYLAITGPYWFKRLKGSAFSHWAPKMIRLDLAVDREDFPPIKRAFNEPGKRRFVYIGHTGRLKNTPYLSDIARRLPGTEFIWIGPGDVPIRGLKRLVVPDFSSPEARRLVAQFDFLINVSTFDANPTTILEAMAWGLIPVCTPQSGYDDIPTILNVPLNDAETAARLLMGLQALPSENLARIQRSNWDLLDTHYTWDRFADQVIEAIESRASPPLGREGFIRRTSLLRSELASPIGPIRRRASAAFGRLRRTMKSPT